MKRFMTGVVVFAATTAFTGFAQPAWAEGRPIAGVEMGAVVPTGVYDDYADPGFLLAPFIGYMMNDFVGVLGHLQGWVQPNEDDYSFQDNEICSVGGAAAGPRFAIPIRRNGQDDGEIYALGTAGIYTPLNSGGAIDHTSLGFSAGAGINVNLTRNWMLGGFARANRLYARVHGERDPQFVTTGLTLMYNFLPPPPPPPPAPIAKAAPPPPPPPPAKKKIVLRGVQFDFDKTAIRADAQPVLDEAISTLKEEGGIAVIAAGHTDSTGPEAYNQQLSVRRAKAVRDYLVAGGIAAGRIQVEGHGESQPVADNSTRDGRAQNRRVVLRVSE